MYSRKYPEIVTATMQRVLDASSHEVLLIRRNTEIHFSKSQKVIGMAIMTNPGSYGFNRLPTWNEFSKNCNYEGEHLISGTGYADLTMQKIIDAVRFGYQETGHILPDGIVRIVNISAIVQPKGKSAEAYHLRAQHLLKATHQELLLSEGFLASEERLQAESRNLDFIIVGFVHNVFQKEAKKLMEYSRNVHNAVYVRDRQGWFSHPRRWQTDKDLMELAKQQMVKVLLNQAKVK